MISLVRPLLAAVLLLTLAGCGGDDDADEARVPTTTPSTQAEPRPSTGTTAPKEPQQEKERPKSAAASLADCIRDASGVSDVLVKASDSEDATFFSDLVGGRVDVLGVTLEGEQAEVTVALFASPADAKKAAPDAGGGGGLNATVHGAAVIVAPAKAETSAIEDCLVETGHHGD